MGANRAEGEVKCELGRGGKQDGEGGEGGRGEVG